MYSNPGTAQALPVIFENSVASYTQSSLHHRLGEKFSRSLLSLAAAELALAAEHAGGAGDINDWVRARFIEHS